MRLAVIGKRGQLACSLREAADAAGVEIITLERPEFELCEPAKVTSKINSLGADIVLNAAAYTAVDLAEQHGELAHAVNAEGAELVARACAHRGIPLIQISTDYVFDGRKQMPYVEADATNPLNAYGRSKCEGERRVAACCPQHVILRTSWLHSPFGHNFIRTMLRIADEREEISVIDDQWGNPTYAPHLAAALLRIAEQLINEPKSACWGIFHATGTGQASWYDVATLVFETSRVLGGPTARVQRIPSSAYKVAAKRPMNSRLDCSKLADVFNVRLPPWRDGVVATVRRLLGART